MVRLAQVAIIVLLPFNTSVSLYPSLEVIRFYEQAMVVR